MSRPFPGMDPYLELPPFWSDFGPRLLSAISNQLLTALLPHYDVRMEEYLLLTNDGERLHRVKPDITVSTPDWWSEGTGGSAVAVAEATTVELEYPETEPVTQRHLIVIHRPTERVVTVLELLSPINKSPAENGLESYMHKRSELLAAPCNLVELDLLRGGRRLPMSGPLPAGDYYALIGRIGRKRHCQVIAWPLRTKLPSIPIPLLPEDFEATLDLDAAFASAYEPSYYSRRLPYREPLAPPVRPVDVDWVAACLKDSGVAAASVSN